MHKKSFLLALSLLVGAVGCDDDNDGAGAAGAGGAVAGSAGSAGTGGTAGTGGSAGQGGAAGKGGASGQGGVSGSSGQGGAAGSACFNPDPPEGAGCTQDADCPEAQFPDCEQVFCDVCVTWQCLKRTVNEQKPCDPRLGKCSPGKGVCSSGYCYSSDTVACQYIDDPCRERVCNPETGGCEVVDRPDGTSCYAVGCKSNQTCQAGECQGGEDVVCPSNPCNEGYCNGQYCDYKPKNGQPCDDGTLCTVDDQCSSNGGYAFCKGKPKTDDCSALSKGGVMGVCLPATGECGTKAAPAGQVCVLPDACETELITDGYGNCVPLLDFAGQALWSESFFGGSAKEWKVTAGWKTGVSASEWFDSALGVPYQEAHPDPAYTGLILARSSGYLPEGPAVADTLLESPPIDLSAATGPVRLAFRTFAVSYDSAQPVLVVEVYDGVAWSLARKLTFGELVPNGGWRTQTVDVTAVKSAAFQVRFRYEFEGQTKLGGNGVHLDEMRLLTDCAP